MDNQNTIIKKRNLPKEVFLHLLAIITLYWSATAFITLLFQFVNYFIPDPLIYDYYSPARYLGPLRFAVSSLVIVFPVFIFVSWLLYKSYIEDETKREFRLRKWLLYFTIFAAVLIIIGSLVRIIYSFLGGEITLRFVLKALSVVATASFIFAYYIDDVRRDRPAKTAKYFAFSISALVLIFVIGGFFIAGSPASERLRRFDEQRVSDLQSIQSSIINYWQRKGKLPSSLQDLTDSISGYRAPADPQTGNIYEYRIINENNLDFELCAVFNKENLASNQNKFAPSPYDPYGYSQNWSHKEGRVCFERNIDKQLYPINPAVK